MSRQHIINKILTERRKNDFAGDMRSDMRGDYYATDSMYPEEIYDHRRNDMTDRADMIDGTDMLDGRRTRNSRGRFTRDRGNSLRLSKSDMLKWKRNLQNADGSQGPHFSVGQIMQSAHHAGIRFDEYDEKEFCMAMNVLYSDFCEAARGFISPDKEMLFFAKFADAFLNDEDGPEASEKLALYFHCIVDD